MKNITEYIKESESSILVINCDNKTDSKWDLQQMQIDLTNGKVDTSISGIRNVVVTSAYLMGKGNRQWSDEIGNKYEDYPVLQITREDTNYIFKMWDNDMKESGPVAILNYRDVESKLKTTGRANAMLNKIFSNINKH